MIILATASAHRQKAFKQLGIDFKIEASDVDEYFNGRPENPVDLVRCLSKMKAESVAKNHSDGVVIGFDSVGWFNSSVLEKPRSKEEAFEKLSMLGGKMHQFYTGVHMINLKTGKVLSNITKTDVFMRKLLDWEIKKYLDQDPHFKSYAVGFDPLDYYSSTFVNKIFGSYNSFTKGIPLETIVEMLIEIGYDFS